MFSTTTSVASRFVGRCCEGKLASRRFASSLRLAATARVPGARTSRFSRALGLVGGSGVRVKGAWRTPTQARLVSTACRSTACGVAPPSSPDSPDSVVDDTVDGSAIPSLKDVPGTQRGETFIMMFTCNQCDTRSARQISKHAFMHGSVLVRCPGCESIHLVADNLDWFKLGKVTLQEILEARGEKVVDANVFDLTPEDMAILAKEANEEGPGAVGEPMPREPVN